jgi:hypothetical protein
MKSAWAGKERSSLPPEVMSMKVGSAGDKFKYRERKNSRLVSRLVNRYMWQASSPNSPRRAVDQYSEESIDDEDDENPFGGEESLPDEDLCKEEDMPGYEEESMPPDEQSYGEMSIPPTINGVVLDGEISVYDEISMSTTIC